MMRLSLFSAGLALLSAHGAGQLLSSTFLPYQLNEFSITNDEYGFIFQRAVCHFEHIRRFIHYVQFDNLAFAHKPKGCALFFVAADTRRLQPALQVLENYRLDGSCIDGAVRHGAPC